MNQRLAWPQLTFGFCLLLALAAPGCGKDSGLCEVTGTIRLDGQPVADAVVVFSPAELGEASQLAAQGVTDENGIYTLEMYVAATKMQEPGAAAGDYSVTVTKLEAVQDIRVRPKHLLPLKYGESKSSGLSASVVEGADNVFDFDLSK